MQNIYPDSNVANEVSTANASSKSNLATNANPPTNTSKSNTGNHSKAATTAKTDISKPTPQPSQIWAAKPTFRAGVALPLAAVLTVGLTLSMAAMIAVEYQPQDKSEAMTFEINPTVEALPPPREDLTIDPLKKVETPPPPPVDRNFKTAAVAVPLIPANKIIPIFEITDITMGLDDFKPSIDRDPGPVVRIPPIFPSRFLQGNHSGFCTVRYDVNAQGQLLNVATTYCSDPSLERPTVKSVLKWTYPPKVQNGRAVGRKGLETKIRYDLSDERGALLPLP